MADEVKEQKSLMDLDLEVALVKRGPKNSRWKSIFPVALINKSFFNGMIRFPEKAVDAVKRGATELTISFYLPVGVEEEIMKEVCKFLSTGSSLIGRAKFGFEFVDSNAAGPVQQDESEDKSLEQKRDEAMKEAGYLQKPAEAPLDEVNKAFEV